MIFLATAKDTYRSTLVIDDFITSIISQNENFVSGLMFTSRGPSPFPNSVLLKEAIIFRQALRQSIHLCRNIFLCHYHQVSADRLRSPSMLVHLLVITLGILSCSSRTET